MSGSSVSADAGYDWAGELIEVSSFVAGLGGLLLNWRGLAFGGWLKACLLCRCEAGAMLDSTFQPIKVAGGPCVCGDHPSLGSWEIAPTGI